MLLKQTRDEALLRSVICHPKLWKHLGDDSCGEAKDYQPTFNEHIWYVAVRHLGELLGVFELVRQTGCCLELHGAFLPGQWRRFGRQAMQGLFAWAWDETGARRIVANVPEYNRPAIRCAESAGMKKCGFNENSFEKHGKAWGRVMLGISRPSR